MRPTKAETKNIQRRLNRLGESLRVDGAFGDLTLGALNRLFDRADQSDNHPVYLPAVDGFHAMAGVDKRSAKNIATLDPKARTIAQNHYALAAEVAERNGVVVKIISGNRTYAEQNELYKQGRTKPGNKVTWAKGGQSNHNFGIAWDYGVFSSDGEYLETGDKTEKALATRVHREIAKEAKRAGLPTEAGAFWNKKDYPHHEVSTGLTLAQKRLRIRRSGSVLS